MTWGSDAGILAKDAIQHFWKIANRAIIAWAGKCFCESFGKNFWRNCFGKNLVKSMIAGIKIFANGILGR